MKNLQHKTILVIEDDRFISRVYLKWLTAAGAKVLIASNGVQGLQMLDDEHVDLVLLDLGMPGLNGYETLTQIRMKPAFKSLPIIIMSNTTLSEGTEEFEAIKKAGVTEILRKYETSLTEISESIGKHFDYLEENVK